MNTRPILAKPKPTKEKKSRKVRVVSNRKKLEGQLEAIVKQIVFWRDGGQCVLSEIDGGRCRGIMNWGHFIPRNKSKYLKYDLATFVQCQGHNMMHDSSKTGGGDPIFGLWFAKTFGLETLEALSKEQREKQNDKGKHTIAELEEMLAHYDDLYDRHFSVTPVLTELVAEGYYGNIIYGAWVRDRKLPPFS